jgi:hypothetical protein
MIPLTKSLGFFPAGSDGAKLTRLDRSGGTKHDNADLLNYHPDAE